MSNTYVCANSASGNAGSLGFALVHVVDGGPEGSDAADGMFDAPYHVDAEGGNVVVSVGSEEREKESRVSHVRVEECGVVFVMQTTARDLKKLKV